MCHLNRITEEIRQAEISDWPGRQPLYQIFGGECLRLSQQLFQRLTVGGFQPSLVYGQAFHSDFVGWIPHQWVVCEGLICDVTAAQFGLRKCVRPGNDPRYKAE